MTGVDLYFFLHLLLYTTNFLSSHSPTFGKFAQTGGFTKEHCLFYAISTSGIKKFTPINPYSILSHYMPQFVP